MGAMAVTHSETLRSRPIYGGEIKVILAEGAIALPVTLSGGALFAS